MFIDLKHNKIISESITEAFERSVHHDLAIMLRERYLGLLGIQMYEDHIADGFMKDGYWYYPMTLVFADAQKTLWLKWQVTRSAFKDGNPYAYVGDGDLAFEIADTVPEEFCKALEGRAIFCEQGLIPIRIDASAQDVSFLSGKYSQTFVDEMARQLTREIIASQGIETLEGSNIELRLVFAPETYMEHTSENVTYRRLLLVDKGCAPRDFWVKWTRLDGATAYTVSDSPAQDVISFEIGEDVPQKVREREYRFLVRVDGDKFHSAMSRKNVTEWREVLRRAIRRGDLVKVETDDTLDSERDLELRRQLSEILGVSAEPVSEPEVEVEAEAEDDIVRLARAAIMNASFNEESAEETVELTVSDVTDEKIEEIFVAEESDEDIEELVALDGEEPSAEPELIAEPEEEAEEEDEPEPEQIAFSLFDAIEEEIPAPEEDRQAMEERIRAEIEAKIRIEYEARARAAAEEEAARLRLENERLMEKARRDAEMKEQEQARLKAEIEAQLRSEARERERLAEAARIAMEERRRLEEERREAELARAREEARLAEEKKRREEEAKIAAERAKEAERIRREREKAAEVERTLAAKNTPKYISRTAEFTFRRIVDPNVTKRIYEIVKATIEFYHKEDVYIRIKASVPDTSTVRLEFLEVPEEEGELVVNIIKALGKSDLGIAKATLD